MMSTKENVKPLKISPFINWKGHLMNGALYVAMFQLAAAIEVYFNLV